MRNKFQKNFKFFFKKSSIAASWEGKKLKTFQNMLSGVSLDYCFSNIKGLTTDLGLMVDKIK